MEVEPAEGGEQTAAEAAEEAEASGDEEAGLEAERMVLAAARKRVSIPVPAAGQQGMGGWLAVESGGIMTAVAPLSDRLYG